MELPVLDIRLYQLTIIKIFNVCMLCIGNTNILELIKLIRAVFKRMFTINNVYNTVQFAQNSIFTTLQHENHTTFAIFATSTRNKISFSV